MLLTVKELEQQLHIKPATLYAWAAQQKIPCLKIHGVVRFEIETIKEWFHTYVPLGYRQNSSLNNFQGYVRQALYRDYTAISVVAL